MLCKSCHKNKEVKARNLCGACYSRWQKTGSTDYKRWGRSSICQINDCSKKAKAKGLCSTHYMRLLRHGHTESTKRESLGRKERHPMWNAWNHIRRFAKTDEVSKEWDDFSQFVIDVGERPTHKHKLYRSNELKRYGPNNFIWKRSFTERCDGEDEKTYKARRMRAYRAINKESIQAIEIKRHYGLSKDQYKEMIISSKNKCKICEKEETAKDSNGNTRKLAIDHCHDTGKVRGLLCTNCNTLIGRANDSVDVLKSAIRYLENFSK